MPVVKNSQFRVAITLYYIQIHHFMQHKMLNQWLYYTIQYLEPNTKSKGGGNHPPLGSRRHNKQLGSLKVNSPLTARQQSYYLLLMDQSVRFSAVSRIQALMDSAGLLGRRSKAYESAVQVNLIRQSFDIIQVSKSTIFSFTRSPTPAYSASLFFFYRTSDAILPDISLSHQIISQRNENYSQPSPARNPGPPHPPRNLTYLCYSNPEDGLADLRGDARIRNERKATGSYHSYSANHKQHDVRRSSVVAPEQRNLSKSGCGSTTVDAKTFDGLSTDDKMRSCLAQRWSES